jgi:hypothetical protein
MPRIASATALLVATLLPIAAFQTTPAPSESVWYWFGDCPKPRKMGIRLLLDGKTIYESQFHACQLHRTDANSERQEKIKASFRFSGGHTFQGTYHTKNSERIEANVWQAGADADDIVLGLSFALPNQILLNTTHIVEPGKSTQSNLDPGLVIKTYPEK